MSAQIKALLAKFKETESTHRGAEVLIGDEIYKFAELLIKECAGIDFRAKVGVSIAEDCDISEAIQEHFGVK